MTSVIIMSASIVLLLGFSAFFSGTESAFACSALCVACVSLCTVATLSPLTVAKLSPGSVLRLSVAMLSCCADFMVLLLSRQ